MDESKTFSLQKDFNPCFYPINALENIGEVIKFYRKKSQLTQEQLANLAGLGRSVVFDIENGKTTVQLQTLFQLLEVLNISLSLHTPFQWQNEDRK